MTSVSVKNLACCNRTCHDEFMDDVCLIWTRAAALVSKCFCVFALRLVVWNSALLAYDE